MNLPSPYRASLLGGTALSPVLATSSGPKNDSRSDRLLRHFTNLTKPAYERLVRNLEGFGNRLSEDHHEALMCIVGRFTMLASGTHSGRYAYDLPCGGGKTQAVVGWAAELWHQKQPYSVLVCQTQVEHLCDLKRQLIENGVPAGEIGLVHTLGDKASLPATSDNDQKKIVLATHQKVRKGKDIAELNTYFGKPRSLVIWDESLLVSDHQSVETFAVKAAMNHVEAYLDEGRASEDLKEAYEYLVHVWAMVANERDRQKAAQEGGKEPRPLQLRLPEVWPEDMERYVAALPSHTIVDPIRQLLAIAHAPLRVITTNQGSGGCIKYDIAVPAALKNVAVLDASWAIRDLERLDKTIKDDPSFNGDVKDYRGVKVRFLKHASGREAMTKAFQRSRSDRKLSQEIVKAVKGIPSDQGVLIFTFKQKTPKDLDMADTLRKDLRAAGIDVDAKVIHQGEEVPRFAWLTWGMETSTSDYQYCPNVIFAGVLHRSDIDLGGAIAGQKDDLTTSISQKEVTKVRRSEIAHGLLQGINRGACRQTVNGMAKPTNVWLIHHDPKVRPLLEKAMPGLGWKEWSPKVVKRKVGKIAALAHQITDVLTSLPEGETSVSTRRLKHAVSAEGIPSQTWKEALYQALGWLPDWSLNARSVVRI